MFALWGLSELGRSHSHQELASEISQDYLVRIWRVHRDSWGWHLEPLLPWKVSWGRNAALVITATLGNLQQIATFELQVSQGWKGLKPNPTHGHCPWVRTRGKPQLHAGGLKALVFFRFACHSQSKTQALRPQGGLDLSCVLYFSPQDFTWTKLLTSLVALLEAGKFYNSPFKLTMLWGAFAVWSGEYLLFLFSPWLSCQRVFLSPCADLGHKHFICCHL